MTKTPGLIRLLGHTMPAKVCRGVTSGGVILSQGVYIPFGELDTKKTCDVRNAHYDIALFSWTGVRVKLSQQHLDGPSSRRV